MKLFHINESAIESAIKRSERHLPDLQAVLEEWKKLSIGNLTEQVFKAILTADVNALRPTWDAKLNEEIQGITTNKIIGAKFKADADIPFLEFVAKVQQVQRDRESPSFGSILALDSFYGIDKGKAFIDKKAIEAHYTIHVSELGQLLFEKAKKAKEAMDEVTAILRENNLDPRLCPVIKDQIPVHYGPFVKPAIDPIFYQRDGEIHLDEDFFYNV